MARIPLIEREADVPVGGEAAWAAISQSRGRVAGPFCALLHSPELARRAADVGAFIRFESVLPGDVRELVILSVARAMDCHFEWAAHAPLASKAGVADATIAAIREGRAPQGLAPAEADIHRYVTQLLRDRRVEEATFRAAEQRFGVRGLVELNTTAAYYAMIACTLNAFEVEPAAEADRLPR